MFSNNQSFSVDLQRYVDNYVVMCLDCENVVYKRHHLNDVLDLFFHRLTESHKNQA